MTAEPPIRDLRPGIPVVGGTVDAFASYLGAGLLEKTAELALLGWANKLAGILLYIALYAVMLSVLLFYAEKVNLIAAGTIASSKAYGFIQPWGPKAMNAIGTLIPVFKDMFIQLEDFFAGISAEIRPS